MTLALMVVDGIPSLGAKELIDSLHAFEVDICHSLGNAWVLRTNHEPETLHDFISGLPWNKDHDRYVLALLDETDPRKAWAGLNCRSYDECFD